MQRFSYTTAALLCAALLSTTASAQPGQSCARLKQALDQRKDGFKAITGERVAQDGVLSIMASKTGPVFLRRALVQSAPGIAPAFVSETDGIASMQEAAATLTQVASEVQACMPGLRTIQEGDGADSSLRFYFVDEQGSAPIVGSAQYDAGRRFFVAQLRIEPQPAAVPDGLRAATPAPPPPPAEAAPPAPAMLKPCEAVKAYVAAAAQGFKPLRGNQLAANRWESNVQIQGYPGAYILGTDTAVLFVPLTNPAPDPTEYDAFYLQFDGMLRDCLTGWARADADNDIEAATYNNAYYVRSPRTITMALRRSKGQYTWVLEVR